MFNIQSGKLLKTTNECCSMTQYAKACIEIVKNAKFRPFNEYFACGQ